MKTGNAILASFFFGMAIYVPIQLLTLINQYNALIRYLPPGLDSISLVLIIFIIFIAFGVITTIFGREKKERKEQEYSEPEVEPKRWMETPKERLNTLEETTPHPDSGRRPKKTKMRFDKPDEGIDLSELVR